MSDGTLRLLIGGVLLLHGLGHGGAFGALLWTRTGKGAGGWLPARSWLFTSLSPAAARGVASVFWIASLLGFAAAALGFWGILVPDSAWRPLAVAFSVVSITGIVLFIGNWPPFNTLTALAVNLAVLITQLWMHWPPQGMFAE